MYCVKCRRHTETNNIQMVTTKNGRLMRRGTCSVCGKTKTQFVKSGGSLLNTVVNKLPFEMYLPGHNFTGPGTKLHKRLNPDGTPKEWSKPINKEDNAAYHHDLCCAKHPDTKTRNELCDKTMLQRLTEIVNPTLRERFERGQVSNLIKSKVNLGLGLATS